MGRFDTNSEEENMTVGVLGASFDTGNLGVSALTECTIKCVLKQWNNAEVKLLGGCRVGGEQHIKVQDMEVCVKKVPIRFCKNVFLARHFCILLTYALLFKIFRWEAFKRFCGRRNSVLKEICELDLVADITGGDSFSDMYGIRRFVFGFLHKWLMVLFNKPLILLPQTYGPFRRPILKMMAKYILKKASIVYSRDSEGVEYLREILGTRFVQDKVRLRPDVAFQLDPKKPGNIDVGNLHEVQSVDTIVVGLNVSGLLHNGGYFANNELKLKVNYPDLVQSVIENLFQKQNVLILLVPHVFPPPGHSYESDPEACQRVYDQLSSKYPNRLFTVSGQYNHNEIKYIIGMSDFFIGSRMHSCIAAISQLIPTVGVAYSKKFIGVFRTVGMEQYVADMRKWTKEEIVAQISGAFDQRHEMVKRLRQVVPGLKDSALGVFEDVHIQYDK